MTPRENMERVLAFDHPEYVPAGIPGYGLSYVGGVHESIDGTGGDGSPVGSRWFDIWGVGWHKVLPDVMGLTEIYPLADITQVDRHPYPDPFDPRICRHIQENPLEYDRAERYLTGFHRNLLFEQAYKLVGMENLFIAFSEEPEAVKSLNQHIIDFHLGLARQYVERGIEWAMVGEDLGTQRGLLFSRDILEEFFVPGYKQLFDYYRSHGVRIHFHSCGCVQDITDIFMDIGVTVLNPVQATANNLALLRSRTQGRMTLEGGISSHIIMEGPPERIREAVRTTIPLLGATGGYICQPDQGLPFPKAHTKAFDIAVEEFGKYPVI